MLQICHQGSLFSSQTQNRFMNLTFQEAGGRYDTWFVLFSYPAALLRDRSVVMDGIHITQIRQRYSKCAITILEVQVSSSDSPLSGPGSADQAVGISSQSCDAEVRDWTCGTSCCSELEGERTAKHRQPVELSERNIHLFWLFQGHIWTKEIFDCFSTVLNGFLKWNMWHFSHLGKVRT